MAGYGDSVRKKYERSLETGRPFVDRVIGNKVRVRAHHPLSAEQFAEAVNPREYASTWEDVQTQRKEKNPEKYNNLVESIRTEGVKVPVQVSAGISELTGKPVVYNGHHRVAAALEAGAEIPYVRVTKPEDDPYYN